MKKIIVTQCFCKAELLEYSLSNLKEFGSGQWDEHWLLIKHYPIDKLRNNQKIRDFADKFGCKVFDCEKDLGLHGGMNYFLEKNPQPAGTRMIGLDPDTAVVPEAKNYDLAMNAVMDARPDMPIVTMWGAGVELHKAELQSYIKNIAGYNVLEHPTVEMYNLSLWDLDWIKSIGGFNEPFKYYGGIEMYLYGKMQETHKKLGYLVDFKENYVPFPVDNHPIYSEYKTAHLGGFTGSMEEYMISKGLTQMFGPNE